MGIYGDQNIWNRPGIFRDITKIPYFSNPQNCHLFLNDYQALHSYRYTILYIVAIELKVCLPYDHVANKKIIKFFMILKASLLLAM